MADAEEVERDLTTDDVARALRLNRATVQRMLASGRLRGYQVGRSWRVSRAAVEKFRRGVKENDVVPYGQQQLSIRAGVIADRREWLKAFDVLSGSLAVRPPAVDSLRREKLYGDRS